MVKQTNNIPPKKQATFPLKSWEFSLPLLVSNIRLKILVTVIKSEMKLSLWTMKKSIEFTDYNNYLYRKSEIIDQNFLINQKG